MPSMINPKILVTGATGRTGGAVVTQLLAKGYPVRATVRVQDARSDLLQRRGAEVVVADIFDPGQLMDALRGVQRAYYCPPYHPFVIQSASAFAVAALPGIAHTIVNPGFFADSPYMEMMPFAAHLGVVPLPVAGESRNAPPSVDDIARVAVAALLDPARHAGKRYRPTGPKLLSVVEMTAVIGHVVGRKVRHVRSPLWMFYKAAKAQGMEPILLSGLRHYFQDHDRGAFAVGAPNDTIRELTGKHAEDFETIARRHAALPESRQSFGARLAALARFLAVPMLPGFDPAAYDRRQKQPMPPTPHLALDDADWSASHGSQGSPPVDSTLKEALA